MVEIKMEVSEKDNYPSAMLMYEIESRTTTKKHQTFWERSKERSEDNA